MRLGYCCLLDDETRSQTGEKYKVNRKLTAKKASLMYNNQRYNLIKARTRQNFKSLYNIMLYNSQHNIHMYRVSSEMIVLNNHFLNDYIWHEDDYIINMCEKIKKFAYNSNIKLSCHPSHYNPIATIHKDKFKIIKKI